MRHEEEFREVQDSPFQVGSVYNPKARLADLGRKSGPTGPQRPWVLLTGLMWNRTRVQDSRFAAKFRSNPRQRKSVHSLIKTFAVSRGGNIASVPIFPYGESLCLRLVRRDEGWRADSLFELASQCDGQLLLDDLGQQ